MALRVALFDVDGTLTTEHTWKAYMAAFRQHHPRPVIHRLFLGIHYPLYFLRRGRLLSEERFRTWWAAHLAWYLRGLTPEQTRPLWRWAAETFLAPYWRTEMLERLRQHRRQGDRVVLVSSAPEPLLDAIAQVVGAHTVVGTRPALRHGRYTGRSLTPVCIGPHKATLTRQHLASLGWEVDYQASAAYADSITDVPLLEMVGHPNAVYADSELQTIAQQRGWALWPPAP